MESWIVCWHFLGDNFEAIIAVCALALTLHSVAVMRKHNKISVKPFLTDHVEKILDKEKLNASFEIINNGLGPAFIKSFDIKYNGEILVYNSDDDLKEKLQDMLSHGEVITSRVLGNGYALAKNEHALLLKIVVSNKGGSKAEGIKKFFDNLSLSIGYESMYGDYYNYTSLTDIYRS